MKSYAAPDDTIPAQNLSIPKIIESAIVLTAGAHKHLATISFDQASEPFYVAGRENELTQVFINLINNSCDAICDRFAGQNSSPNGEIKIMLEKIGGRLKITYKDNGCGIPEEISRRIFDLFFTTKPIGKGTGQGLAISLAIIKRFNGDIYYKPAPPDGSMFIIELDLAKEMPVEASDLVSC
jgi:two-component system, NtrC family, sensor kinase